MKGGNKSISSGMFLHWNSVEMWKEQLNNGKKKAVVILNSKTKIIKINISENIAV